jgi:Concanavalin A-like lectin/glucanases superfamily
MCLHSVNPTNLIRAYLRPGVALSILLAFGSLVTLSANAQQGNGPATVEGSNGEWFVENSDRAGDARFAEFLGRQALWVRNNTQIVRSGIDFANGTIEFDVSPMDKGHFIGLLFRRATATNHENIYLRVHRSGLYNALQYAARINGSSTWQLYPEFNTTIDLPRNQWTHVRVEVQGTQLEVYLNNNGKPILVVPRLRAIHAKGSVAFWGRVNDDPATWAAAISNVSIRPSNPAETAKSAPAPPPAGTLTSWEVAGPVQSEKLHITIVPQLKDWRRIPVEESGLVNLNRALGPVRGRWTGFARTSVKASAAQTVLLELGYSDDVVVFLNGEPIYAGVNGFASRHPEYMGFVNPGFETVALKLRPGDNEIVLAVTDDQRFGWGFVTRVKELPRLQ